MLDWNIFKTRFSGKEQKAFEDLSYFLFCEETEQKYGIFAYKDQWGIEAEPIMFNGKWVGFQAKYYDSRISDNAEDIKSSINKAIKKNGNLQQIYFYLNNSFKESTKPDKKTPEFISRIEKDALDKGVNIIWKVPYQMEYMLGQEHNWYIRNLFFEEWERPQNIVKTINIFNKSLSDYPSFTDKKEYERDEKKGIIEFVNDDDKDNIVLVAGDAGTGKSVIMKQVLKELTENKNSKKNIPVLAIKADYNQFRSIDELEKLLQLKHSLVETIKYLIKFYHKMVLIVDQIDALSLTLSKDRHDLELYRNLITSLALIDGLRIVVSCREYDLNYETFLQPLTEHHIIRVKKLNEETVKKFIEGKGADYDSFNDFTKNLLSIPLYLSLFCKVYTPGWNSNVTSLDDLYDRLWDKYINAKELNIDKKELTNTLEDIAFRMYDRQELVIGAKILEDNHGPILDYLKSSGLIQNVDGNKIQFFHQSFFDYVYARSYVDEDKHLYKDLLQQHQGFFIRARVKSVLDYLRSANSTEYIDNIRHILQDAKYKTHIKFLVLNTVGFQINPSDEEKNVFDKIIKPNSFFYENFIDNLWSGPWLDYFIDKGYILSVFDESNQKLIDKLVLVAYRRPDIYGPIIKLLTIAKNSNYEHKFKFIESVLTKVAKLNITAYNNFFIDTYLNWNKDEVFMFLNLVCEKNPKMVADVLKALTKEYYKSAKLEIGFEYIPYNRGGFFGIVQIMSKRAKIEWTNFLMWFIDFVLRATLWPQIDGRKMRDSKALYVYSSHKAFSSGDDIEDYYTELIKLLKEIAVKTPKDIEEYLRSCQDSYIDNLVTVSVICYTANPGYFKTDISKLLTDEAYYEGSPWLTFNLNELMRNSFEMLDKSTQNAIIDLLFHLHPDWENSIIKSNGKKYPIREYGITAYKFMEAIPDKYIKNSKVYSLYKEYEHKFGNVSNTPPKGVQIHSGEPALPKEAYDNMSIQEWKHSFTEIVSDNTGTDWNKPTLTGHAMAFCECIKKDWKKFQTLIREICNDKFNVLYSIYACKGLYESNADAEFATEIIENIITNFDSKSLQDMFFLNSIEYIIKKGKLTDKIFKFLYQMACDKDCEYENEDNQFKGKMINDAFFYGLRGLAASVLIKCYKYKQYCKKIFEALFKIAKDGNMATRVAVILNMAYLQNVNQERNIELFLALQSPSMPELTTIPISSSNPLLYMRVSDFKALIPYFKSIMALEMAGGPLKTILFIAWLKGYEGSEDLLNQALSANLSGMEDVYRQAVEGLKINQLKKKSYEFIMRCLEYDDKKLGKIVDDYFHGVVGNLKDDKTDIDDFINKLIVSKISIYQRRELYKYLKDNAGLEPEKTLHRLQLLQQNKSEEEDSCYSEESVFEIIVRAYNSIYKFDKTDDLLEFAIDLFDSLLEEGKLGSRGLKILADLEK